MTTACCCLQTAREWGSSAIHPTLPITVDFHHRNPTFDRRQVSVEYFSYIWSTDCHLKYWDLMMNFILIWYEMKHVNFNFDIYNKWINFLSPDQSESTVIKFNFTHVLFLDLQLFHSWKTLIICSLTLLYLNNLIHNFLYYLTFYCLSFRPFSFVPP